MPTSKDLKRLVRARMAKTGEAYTAARAQVVSKHVPRATLAPVPAPIAIEPVAADYAKLAGMSDEKVKAATGCTWEKWVFSLDRKKAYELSHRELAQLIEDKYKRERGGRRPSPSDTSG